MSDNGDDQGLAEIQRRFDREARAKHARDLIDEAAQRAGEPSGLPEGQRYETEADLLGIAPARRGRGRPAIGERERREYLHAHEKLPRKNKPATTRALANAINIDERTLRRWLVRLPGLPAPDE